MAWGKPIINRYPVTVKEIEKKIGLLNAAKPLKVVTDSALAGVIAKISSLGVVGGITISIVIGLAENDVDKLSKLCDTLKSNPSKYTGVRFVQEYNPGPIYGYYTIGRKYYELY